ncbi:hypothetical protein NUU61_008633 [Penicillium alfredii]|uniref:CST complex subunit STN1 n=1 Tax=Penicillium alfredii TaxID=1506179 RepID=A0A9W9ELS9_9EURO|nr:uncharacterized protein NUU61_008633 [Penicillium alfredii]KAJ5084054.1 hypothetical protein NUU61_008633 [Penicillium alfredii]
MDTAKHASPVFYPAFCFKASPTHFAWVKMAAADVHRLQRRRGFEGQNIFFYNNHPIRFVSLVGLVVARTEVPRRTILTLDDSSGATIDVAVLQADPRKDPSKGSTAASKLGIADADPDAAVSIDSTEISTADGKTISTTTPTAATGTATHVSATDRTELDISRLTPGTTVRVKGTLSLFRATMQLHLERFTLVRDTNAEMQFLDERLQFLVEVLAVPWVLLDEEVEQLRGEAERGDLLAIEEKKRAEQKVKRRAEREERDQRHIQKRYEREERKRDKEAGVCREDGVKVMRKIRRRKVLQGE